MDPIQYYYSNQSQIHLLAFLCVVVGLVFLIYLYYNPQIVLEPYNFVVSAFSVQKPVYTSKEKTVLFPDSTRLEKERRLLLREARDCLKEAPYVSLPQVEKSPFMSEFLESRPDILRARFISLDPGETTQANSSPCKGILRYVLLLTEGGIELNIQKEETFIEKDLLYDPSYVNYLENDCDWTQIMLILDVKRPFEETLLSYFSKLFFYGIRFSTQSEKLLYSDIVVPPKR